MKLRKSEVCAIILTAMFLVLLFGYNAGRGATSGRYTIETEVAAPTSAPETSATPEPAEEEAEDDGAKDGETLLVNINTAGEEELTKLEGIGEALAQRIISYRDENGAFGKKEDITKVSGIGAGIYEKIYENITIG